MVKAFDLNSAYLSVMRSREYPHPNTARWVEAEKWRDFKFCVVEADVFVPVDLFYPPLPYRLNGKLIFPVGRFSGVWNGVELGKAEEMGVQVKPKRVLAFNSAGRIFEKFAKWVWTERKKLKSQGREFEQLMVKTIGNSLYGKFGERQSLDRWGKLDEFKPEQLEGKNVVFKEIDGEVYVAVTGAGERNTSHTFSVIASHTTSYVRLILLDALLKNKVVYCDTDSVFIADEKVNLDLGNELGEWKFEGEFEFKAVKPKFYAKNGSWKIKGVKKGAEQVGEWKYKFKKPIRFREAIRTGEKFNVWREVVKELSLLDDKRVQGEDGFTYPIRL